MNTRQQIVPYQDVASLSDKLRMMGYVVLGSDSAQGLPGFCMLHFQSPAPVTSAPQVPAMLDPLQKRAAQAIVNIFETGEVLGKYGQVTVIPGDSGHLTFGRSQTTLASGNLARLISEYCAADGARFGVRLKEKYRVPLSDLDVSLDTDYILHNLLRATADDPVMRDVQDRFFDRTYWESALREAKAMQIYSALGIAVVYDSIVHGSWAALRDKTNQLPGAQTLDEHGWINAYITTRGDWLANHQRPDLRPTVYRMQALKRLAEQDNWNLELPFVVRNKEVSLVSLFGNPPGCYDGPAVGSRALAVTSPFARGADVRRVQLGLSDVGYDVTADGVFGPMAATAIKKYQLANNLPATGMADRDLIARIAG